MSASSQLSFAIQLHQLDWQDFSATLATLPALPGRKPEVLAAFDSYGLAELLLQPENIIDRLQQQDLVGLILINWLIEAGQDGLSQTVLDKKLNETIPWLSKELREQAITNIRFSALIGFTQEGKYRCWNEVATTKQADSTASSVNELDLVKTLVSKTVPPVTTTKLPSQLGSGYEFLAALRELMRLLQLRPTKLRIDGLPVKSELDRIEPLLPPAIIGLVKPTIALLGQTRLTDTDNGQLVLTDLAEEFIRQEPAVEWSRLAAHWLGLFPAMFQQALAARTDLSIAQLWKTLYPWPDTDMNKFSVTIEELAQIGEAIGLVHEEKPTELLYRFSDLLDSDRMTIVDELSESAENHSTDTPLHAQYPIISNHLQSLVLPESKLYLQNDLSAVATGPLTHTSDAKLSSFSEKESIGFAPSYRFSAETLNRAWRSGSTPEQLRELLTQLAKNDAPLALEYLIDDSYQTAGHILVSQVLQSGDVLTVIRTPDELSRELLRRDPKLNSLKLQFFDDALISALDFNSVADILIGAGHPCIVQVEEDIRLVQADSVTETADTAGKDAAGSSEEENDPAPTVVEELWARIQKEPVPDAKGQVLSSLEKRGSTHPPYWFTIVLQDDSEQRLQLQPLGLAAGRLRARDIVAETERTIPLRRVIKIEEIHESEILGK